jgi:hypothetical protein
VCGAVLSVDVNWQVLAEAALHLRNFPDLRVQFVHGDGRLGWAEGAPYDRIQVTAASPDLEPAWLEQLTAGGLLQVPLELAPGLAYLLQGSVRNGRFEGRLTRSAYFMPLRDEENLESPPDGANSLLPDPNRLASVAAPWGEWVDRRRNGPGLTGALAFLGWLEGLAVAYQSLAEGRPVYGLADLVAGNACWLGQSEWRVTGKAGEELGCRLWQTFLDAGGPRPTEFRLTAWPCLAVPPQQGPAASTIVLAHRPAHRPAVAVTGAARAAGVGVKPNEVREAGGTRRRWRQLSSVKESGERRVPQFA